MDVSRDGGLIASEDAVISVASSLALEASMLFQSQKFAECVDVLGKLSLKKGDDPKVLHNIAVAEFFRDGCSDLNKFVLGLISVEEKCNELACASGELVGVMSQPVDTATPGSDGDDTVGQNTSWARIADVVFRDEFDASVATLNKAIIFYYLHDYQRAMSVLEPLFQNIAPLHEVTAIRVCHLLLDLAVATQDTLKFADVVNYIEKAYNVDHTISQADIGSMGLQPLKSAGKSLSVPSITSTADDLDSDASVNTNDVEVSYSDEPMELGLIFPTPASENDRSKTQPDIPALNDLKLKLPLYKVQFLLLTRSLKMAKRDLKLAMNISHGGDSSSPLLLKSQLQLARGNFIKAEKLLKAYYNQVGVGSCVKYNNNIGCILSQCGKYNTAGVFFRRALLSCSSLRKEIPRNIVKASQDKSMLIMYNCGLQYLACGNPFLAAQCFEKASRVFYNRPLLWLRQAECSIMALNKGLLKPFGRLLWGPEFKVNVIGQGKWRRLAVEDELTTKGHARSKTREDLYLGRDKAPKLSISFARQCLRNAFYLVQNLDSKSGNSGLSLKTTVEETDSSEVASSKSSNHKNQASGDTKGSKVLLHSGLANTNGDMTEQKIRALESNISLYSDTFRRESLLLKQAILADLAFVELELGNPQGALSRAQSLLQISECSKMSAFLARVYAAEALCLLNKPKEAAEYLLVYISAGHDINLPFSNDDCAQWQLNKHSADPEDLNAGSTVPKNTSAEVSAAIAFYRPQEAQGALYVNLASMSAMEGNLEQATMYAMRALSLIPNSRESNLMAVYLDLKLGRVEAALTRLKKCSCASFVLCGSRLKGSS